MSAGIKRFLWYSTLWVIVIALSLAGGYCNSILTDAPYHIGQELPFLARWIVWIPLTPLAVFLSSKMSYTGSKGWNFVIYHFSVYLLLCTVQVFAASLTAKLINVLLQQPAPYAMILRKCALTGLFFNFVVYSLMLLALNVMQYYRAFESEKLKTVTLERSLLDSRLQFLTQQLQPHFLFNTHHSIITLIKLGEKDKATQMLEKLSDLMRIALREAHNQKTTLETEIETLKLYVDIQKTRFEDKMGVEYNIDEPAQLALVPCMILQPLVENSIKYAVECAPGATWIKIFATCDDGKLTLIVKDVCSNGSPAAVNKKGTGLTNSEERIHKLYGGNSSFLIAPYGDDKEGGMQVKITMPLQYAAM